MAQRKKQKWMLSKIRFPSSSWVMLHEREGFVRLPNEQLIYTSPPRTSISLQPPSQYSGRVSFSIQSSAGIVYLTNQRIVYLPSQPTQQLKSFSAPLLNLHDTHVSAPFFGPNVWTALVQPVAGGGIPPSLPAVQLKMTFKEGGAFDFHSNFERIKERLQQAMEYAQMTRSGSPGTVDYSAVHLDELPAYDGPGNASTGLNPSSPEPYIVPPGPEGVPPSGEGPKPHSSSGEDAPEARFETPSEPPPAYEEVQQQSVANELENRLRRES
ncbi:hypothetical protein M432DRAFT_624672 [Thermoascus aurantiacus ATCC 26904]